MTARDEARAAAAKYKIMSHLPCRADIPVRDSNSEEQQARDVINRLEQFRRVGEVFYTIPPLPDSPEIVIEKLRAELDKMKAAKNG